MKAKLTLNGIELEVEISDNQIEKLFPTKEARKTGYERKAQKEEFFIEGVNGANVIVETNTKLDEAHYNQANYYSELCVAENNSRATTLLRQLRRFSVEHRAKEFDWENDNEAKWYIYYAYDNESLEIDYQYSTRDFGGIYFDSEKVAEQAILKFGEELYWYFTEYKDSL